MGQIKPPQPVKLTVAMLASRQEWFAAAERLLAHHFGPIDLASDPIPFTFTKYYGREMGPDLLRKFIAHEPLIEPDQLAPIKVKTNDLEAQLAAELHTEVRRPVNLDPGIVDASRLVLATTKDYTHRVYLGQGIYAEVTLAYRKGQFKPMPWTYRDYATDAYREFFTGVRDRYLEQLKAARGGK